MVKMPKSGFRAVPRQDSPFFILHMQHIVQSFPVFSVKIPPDTLWLPLLQKMQENVATAALCAVFAVFHKEKISFP